MDTIKMEHGSGGFSTGKLIQDIFADTFGDPTLDEMEDAAVLPGAPRIALTTDSFVVEPIKYRGGDIGRLAVCGTVNDLLMRGAIPRYLTCGFILQTGLELSTLREIVQSMAKTAAEAGVRIVAGDTKVVTGDGALTINTAGVGFVADDIDIAGTHIEAGDVILVSGDIGRHHAAILSERLSITNTIESDNAPLTESVKALLDHKLHIHAMRDVTRGGLATILKELAKSTGLFMELEEETLPIDAQIRDFCGMLGLDPLYMGCEGRMVVLLPQEEVGEALAVLRRTKYTENAALIGHVYAASDERPAGILTLKTSLGTHRLLDVLHGEGLPRIC